MAKIPKLVKNLDERMWFNEYITAWMSDEVADQAIEIQDFKDGFIKLKKQIVKLTLKISNLENDWADRQ